MTEGTDQSNTDTSRIPRAKIGETKPTAAPHIPVEVQKEDGVQPGNDPRARMMRPITVIKPGETKETQAAPAAPQPAGESGTDTVSLKVVREPKKAAASQTVKLRPPTVQPTKLQAAAPTAATQKLKPAPAAAGKTVKLKAAPAPAAPQPEKTVKMQAPAPQQQPQSTGTPVASYTPFEENNDPGLFMSLVTFTTAALGGAALYFLVTSVNLLG